jgi:AcrR family transcriptional regulator
MSPRGVAIPDLRAQLFEAADRVLVRDGPGGLTSRAITREAGVAKGVLHNHFTDLDGFLAGFMLERFGLIAEEAAKLPARAGEGTVVGNLTDAVLSVFGGHATALLGLATARPELVHRLAHSVSAWSPSLGTIEGAFAAYLDAERELGRIPRGADTETLALALIGTVHHLLMSHRTTVANSPEQVRRIVEALFRR